MVYAKTEIFGGLEFHREYRQDISTFEIAGYRYTAKMSDLWILGGDTIQPLAKFKQGRFTRRISQMSLLQARDRKLSISDGALNTREIFLKDIQEENKRNSINETDDILTIPRNNSFTNSRTKNKRKEGITKMPEMMSRFLGTSNKKKFRRRESIISRILSNNEKEEIMEDNSNLLRHAVRKYDTQRVLDLLSDQLTNIDGANEKGVTALHEAGIDGNIVCIKVLVTKGASINVTDGEGFTPLDYAVFAGSFECAAYLIEKGAKDDRIKDGQIMHKEHRTSNRKTRFSGSYENK